MTNEEIQKEAYKLYRKTGPVAVYELASKEGIKDFQLCNPCEAMTPIVDNTCLICGTVIREEGDKITPEKAITEIIDVLNDVTDDEHILKIYKMVCWDKSELIDGKIVLFDKK